MPEQDFMPQAACRITAVIGLSVGLLVAGLVGLPYLMGLSFASPPQASQAQANTITGLVFRDFNANGTQDIREIGIFGIAITAYNASDTVVGTATTDAGGNYTLPVPDGTQVRIEFGGFPSYLQPGPAAGTNLQTTVAFTTSPASGINLALANPRQYCQATPDLATNCYVSGPQTPISDVLIAFPVDAGNTISNSTTNVDNPAHTRLAGANDVGSTWGLAHQASSSNLFAAAFMKRHAGFGTGGPAAIYRVDRNTNSVSLFVDLAALGFSAGTDPHPTDTVNCPGTNQPPPSTATSCWEHDPNSWDWVGKMGLGDLDISEDDTTLYVVNLSDRRLYELPIGLPPSGPTAPTAGQVGQYDIPNPCTNQDDWRPFGVGVHDGKVYVGGVCTAESSQNTGDLSAYIYEFDPLVPGFNTTPVLNFALNYPRGCAIVRSATGTNVPCNPAAWNPWSPVFTATVTVFSSNIANEHVYPQPWLTDIEFDYNGDMIIGIRDRFGDQTGFNQRSTDITANELYSGDVAGDLLRACFNGTNWTLENNGQCGGIGPGPQPLPVPIRPPPEPAPVVQNIITRKIIPSTTNYLWADWSMCLAGLT